MRSRLRHRKPTNCKQADSKIEVTNYLQNGSKQTADKDILLHVKGLHMQVVSEVLTLKILCLCRYFPPALSKIWGFCLYTQCMLVFSA